jgi:CRP-like cAMP-binding protein
MGSTHRFWELLTLEERRVLLALGREKKYPPGATMCVEGDATTHVFVLLHGWVKILSVTNDGHESVLALRSSGETVGETAGEVTGHRNATIQAIGSVRALIVSYSTFSSFLDTHPNAGHAYRRVMAQRWSEADMMLRRRAVTTGAQRLADLVLDLAGRHGTPVGAAIDLALPLSQEELATLVGTSRATVTRALKEWRKRGFVRTGQHRITIIDLPGLQQVAASNLV